MMHDTAMLQHSSRAKIVVIAAESEKRLPYVCECGEKWTFSSREAESGTTTNCRCGRNIVARKTAVYATGNGHSKRFA